MNQSLENYRKVERKNVKQHKNKTKNKQPWKYGTKFTKSHKEKAKLANYVKVE